MPLEFFGQGEVMELARKSEQQLALIDEHINFQTLKIDERGYVDDLSKTIAEHVGLESRIEELAQVVAEKDGLVARRDYLDRELAAPVFVNRAKWNTEKNAIQWALSEIGRIESELGERSQVPTESLPAVDDGLPNAILVGEVIGIILAIRDRMKLESAELSRTIAEHKEILVKFIGDWKLLDEVNEREFQQAIESLGGSEIESIHRDKLETENKLKSIVETIEPELEMRRAKLSAFVQTRKTKLTALTKCRERIHYRREHQLKGIHKKLKSVQIRLETSADRSEYSAVLKAMLYGSGIQNQDDQVQLIVDALVPHEIARYVLDRDETSICARTKVTQNTAARMISKLSRAEAMTLQSIAILDRPDIQMRRSGEKTFTSLDDLSIGEKCSAMLSIALLEKSRPLLIDQPEDELDSLYVIDDVVANMRAIKSDRQLIVATHEPNIPVLGDAELVIRVTKDVGVAHCTIKTRGCLEDELVMEEVLNLEGGRVAFDKRSMKYNLNPGGT